jgi:Uma2 family endonuclease
MFAMAGAREAHNLLVMNLLGELREQLRSRPCRPYPSDMRVRVKSSLFTYPDVTVVCGDPQFLDERRDTLLNPDLIVEVLSPSTEAYDRGRKFEHYKSLPSFREYFLLASDRVHADLYTRQPDDRWNPDLRRRARRRPDARFSRRPPPPGGPLRKSRIRNLKKDSDPQWIRHSPEVPGDLGSKTSEPLNRVEKDKILPRS